jgi:hypothetical protein
VQNCEHLDRPQRCRRLSVMSGWLCHRRCGRRCHRSRLGDERLQPSLAEGDFAGVMSSRSDRIVSHRQCRDRACLFPKPGRLAGTCQSTVGGRSGAC